MTSATGSSRAERRATLEHAVLAEKRNMAPALARTDPQRQNRRRAFAAKAMAVVSRHPDGYRCRSLAEYMTHHYNVSLSEATDAIHAVKKLSCNGGVVRFRQESAGPRHAVMNDQSTGWTDLEADLRGYLLSLDTDEVLVNARTGTATPFRARLDHVRTGRQDQVWLAIRVNTENAMEALLTDPWVRFGLGGWGGGRRG